MIADLDPQALAQREMQQKAEIANMAIKFCLARCSQQGNAETPQVMAEFALTLAERLHGYVTMPPPTSRIMS